MISRLPAFGFTRFNFCGRALLAGIFSLTLLPWIRATEVPNSAPTTNSSLTATDVFNALDLTQPELATVAAAWKKKDEAGAVKALADYMRARTDVHWLKVIDGKTVPMGYNHGDAEDALKGRVNGGVTGLYYEFPDGKIDWLYNATLHATDRAPDLEWQWQLNRVGFWHDLAGAYQATGDERYAIAFTSQLRTWLAQCPPPNPAPPGNTPGTPWRTLEAGIRMQGSWPDSFFVFIHSPSFTDADLVAMLGGFLEHGRYLLQFHGGGNWYIAEMHGLYNTGTLFPEFREASAWREHAVQELTAQTHLQYYPDGSQRELSTGYQGLTIRSILAAYETARKNGREKEFPADYTQSMIQGFAWDMKLMTPDRKMPKFNDSEWMNVMQLLKGVVDYFPERTDFRWVATDGKEGTPPKSISDFLNYSGFVAMRSGWDRQANYAAFRVGPIGAGHIHQNKLDLQLWAFGREVLWGDGGGQYEKSKWNTWARTTAGHNCMTIDGLGQQREADPFDRPAKEIDAHWQSTPVFDFVSGVYDEGYGPGGKAKPATQRRDVLFLRPDIFIVADRVKPNDSAAHTYQNHWNLITPNTQTDPATQAVVTTDADKPNLAIVPLLADGLDVKALSGQETPEIVGWVVQRDAPLHYPGTGVLHTRSGTGAQTLLTLFLPLDKGVANPVLKVSPIVGQSAAEITFKDGRRLRVACPGDVGISVQETMPDGKPGRAAQGGV